jgi:hypothetical protein
MPSQTKHDAALHDAISRAKRAERETGQRRYVLWSVAQRKYVITKTMPYLGRWYDADGIQHGS